MNPYSRRSFIQTGAAYAAGIAASTARSDAQVQGLSAPAMNHDTEAYRIHLNTKEYFSAPGFSFLLFHNNYQVGFQGGLQMIQNGERILDSGDFYALLRDGGARLRQSVLRRVINPERSAATVEGEVSDWQMKYRLICATDGESMEVTLKTLSPIPRDRVQEAGFRFWVYPGDYYSKSYQADHGVGTFPQQYTGQRVLAENTTSLFIAAEDSARRFRVTRSGGTLRLADNRANSPQHWFSIEAPLSSGTEQNEVQVRITPSILPGWKKTPVIAVSQAGYHPGQAKRAVIELDPRDELESEARLYRLEGNGTLNLIKRGQCSSWGRFLRYHYMTFDFTEIRESGIYKLAYGQQEAGPFPIHKGVYETACQPTLEYFLPIQMCHVKVQEGVRTWHGACHLDDALQAPAHKVHIDGYQQGDLDGRFAANEHIPGLNWGGWHDAGDHDLPAGSIAMTTLALAMAEEDFHPRLDQTSIDRQGRLVSLHVSDGKPDLLQQIEYGAEGLLLSYRVGGHIFSGIIESNPVAYSHLGDPVDITDNRVYDPSLKPGQTVCDRSGDFDDRWAFTNRNTGLQYETAQALAAASRVLRSFQSELATECLETAEKLWDYEQSHPATYWRCGYNPPDSGFRSQEIAATAELLITTGNQRYRKHLLALMPVWQVISAEQFGTGPGWTLARALPLVNDAQYTAAVHHLAEKWQSEANRRAASNPFGVRYPSGVSNPGWKLETRSAIHSSFVWGSGWDLQQDAFRQYYLHKQLPHLFAADPLLAVVSFVLGCHPATNESFVSGVGTHSAPVAYGFNRADWSCIPGGVFSGCSLIKPDFMELKVFPFLWYQREYVIHGAATYIFLVLAANQLLNS
jgi:endoglucanase